MKDEFVLREKKILSLIEQEIENGENMAAAVGHMAERMLLEEKGYTRDDIRTNVLFDVTLGAETIKSSLDIVVTIDHRNAMVIKCAAGSLASRERHVVAAARVFGVLPVPVAVVMDPMDAVILDSMSGKVIAEGFDAIPSKERLRLIITSRELSPILPEKLEREKRVLLAFDAIKCCIPQGVEGGVAIGDNNTEL